MVKQKFQNYVYDFTLSINKTTEDHKEIIKEIKTLCKKFSFQKEQGEEIQNLEDEYDEDYNDIVDNGQFNEQFFEDMTPEDEGDEMVSLSSDEEMGDSDFDEHDLRDSDDYDSDDCDSDDSEEEKNEGYRHFQGRISLIKKLYIHQLKELLNNNNYHLRKAHFSSTSTNNSGHLFYSYSQKLMTRIDGPYTDLDEEDIPMLRQLKHIKELHSYQQEIIDRSRFNWNNRNINVLIDTQGCKGKSTLALWCAVNKLGRQIPPLNNYEDIMALIMCMPISPLYFIDMPRALNKNKMYEFFSGIESIKNGYCFDKRYKWTEKYFDSPEIWIFMNSLQMNQF